MMPWFCSQDRICSLQAVAKKWLGTPFAGNSCQPGPRGGVSCQMLASAIYREVGFGDFCVPEVYMAHARYNTTSLVVAFMASRPEFRMVADQEPRIGDLLGFRIGKSTHHVGILVEPGRFVHAIETLGTIESLLADPTWKTRLTHVWRPI